MEGVNKEILASWSCFCFFFPFYHAEQKHRSTKISSLYAKQQCLKGTKERVGYFSFPLREVCLKVLLYISPNLWRQSSVEKSSLMLPWLSCCSFVISAFSPQPCFLSSRTRIYVGDLDQFLNITSFQCGVVFSGELREKNQEVPGKVNNLSIKRRQHIAIGKITNLLLMRHFCLVVGIIWENF